MALLLKIILEDDEASAVSWSVHICFFLRGLNLDIPHIQLLHKVQQMNINLETFDLLRESVKNVFLGIIP